MPHFLERLPGVLGMKDGHAFSLGKTTSLPTCEARRRGEQRQVNGGAGVADLIKVCLKDANDGYAWVYAPTVLYGTGTWNPGALASGADEGVNVTVTGAVLGDMAVASLDSMTAAAGGRWAITANVNDTNNVVVRIVNYGSSVNLASGTVRVYVFKRPS